MFLFGSVAFLRTFSRTLPNTNARSRTRMRSPITPERSIEYRLTNVLVRFWSVLANVLTNAPEQEFSAFPRTAQMTSINKTLIAVVINVSLMIIAFTSNLMSVTTSLILVTNFFEIAWLIKYRKLKLLLRLVVQ